VVDGRGRLISRDNGDMAHIYIYSPSGAVRDKAAFKRGVARLKNSAMRWS